MAKLRVSVALSYSTAIILFIYQYASWAFDIPNFSSHSSGLSHNDHALQVLIHSVPYLLNPWSVLFGSPFGLVLYFAFINYNLYSVVADWWIPYFYGCCGKWVPTEVMLKAYRVYMASKKTILPQFLPNNPIVPDVEVTGLSVLLVASWIFTLFAIIAVYRGVKKSNKSDSKSSEKNKKDEVPSPAKKVEVDNAQITQRKKANK